MPEADWNDIWEIIQVRCNSADIGGSELCQGEGTTRVRHTVLGCAAHLFRWLTSSSSVIKSF